MGVLCPISVLEHNQCRWTGCAVVHPTYPATKNTMPKIKKSPKQPAIRKHSSMSLSDKSPCTKRNKKPQTRPHNPMKTMPATRYLFFNVFRMIFSLFRMQGRLVEQRAYVRQRACGAESVAQRACGAERRGYSRSIFAPVCFHFGDAPALVGGHVARGFKRAR